MRTSAAEYFEAVKHYCCSEALESCRDCETNNSFRKVEERIKNKEVTWTKKHLPYIGPDYGAFPKVVFLGYDDPNTCGYEMDCLRKYLLGELEPNKFKKKDKEGKHRIDKHRAGQNLFIEELLSNNPRPFLTISTLNSHLCSCVKEGTSDSMMHLLEQPCRHSWRILLELLSPDVIIIEGKKQWDSSKRYLDLEGKGALTLLKALPNEDNPRGALYALQYITRRILVLLLYHPSRHWAFRTQPYYTEVVLPLIQRCRTELENRDPASLSSECNYP